MRTHAWWPRHPESSTPETVGTIELPHDVEGDLEVYGDRSVLVWRRSKDGTILGATVAEEA